MHVFVTGASGWVGTAVCKELKAQGHTVLGLARSDASAQAISSAGHTVHRGSLTDLDSLISAAKSADGIIHTAFEHNFSSMEAFAASSKIELAAVGAIAGAIEGTTKPFIISSGTAGLYLVDGTEPANEDSDRPAMLPRIAAEKLVLELAKDKSIHTSIVRLAPTTHGVGEEHGFMCRMISAAKKEGYSGYIDEGKNRWPAVHRNDAAKVYVLALEKNAVGGVYHAIQDEGVEIRTIAEVIGRKVGVPTKSLTKDEAQGVWGFLAMIIGLDTPCSAPKTKAALGWSPTGPTLLEDLEDDGYYKSLTKE